MDGEESEEAFGRAGVGREEGREWCVGEGDLGVLIEGNECHAALSV